jgi:hypothetical protein
MMMDDGDNGVDNDECWSHIIYPIYILGLMLFPPQEVFSRAGAWVTIRIKNFRIMMLSHKEALTQRNCYTQKLLRTETQKLMHIETFTQRSLYKGAFTHRSFGWLKKGRRVSQAVRAAPMDPRHVA